MNVAQDNFFMCGSLEQMSILYHTEALVNYAHIMLTMARIYASI